MERRLFRAASMGLALVSCVFLSGAWHGMILAAQTPAGQSPAGTGQSKPDSSASSNVRKDLGVNADSIQPYKSAGRDPFRRMVVINKAGGEKRIARPVGFPALDVRRTQFRQKLAQAHSTGGKEPEPLSQYLVSEVTVIGTFSDDQGPGVFLRAQPSGSTFFVRRGARCYNGEVLRIETDPSDLSSARVVFKETSYAEQEGKQIPTDRVVTKSVGSH